YYVKFCLCFLFVRSCFSSSSVVAEFSSVFLFGVFFLISYIFVVVVKRHDSWKKLLEERKKKRTDAHKISNFSSSSQIP
ncbi:hypothetical protein L9F63_013282, partial [Diploptera punctata]